MDAACLVGSRSQDVRWASPYWPRLLVKGRRGFFMLSNEKALSPVGQEPETGRSEDRAFTTRSTLPHIFISCEPRWWESSPTAVSSKLI
jgi:hypothetical protein